MSSTQPSLPGGELPTQPDSFRLLEFLLILAKRKGLMILLPLAAGGLALVVSFLLPVTYKSTIKVMPPQESPSLSSAILLQLGPLAGLAGKDLGLRSSSDLYIVMLHSESISNALIDRFSLLKGYKVKRRIDAQRRLLELTEISAGKEGVITVSVTDPDRSQAAAIANAYIEELQTLTRTLAITEAGKRRLFFEHEVQNASDELARAEESLKKIQETTGIIQVDNQSKAMIESLSTLQAQVASKEAQVRVLQGYATDENPELVRTKSELESLRRELTRVEAGQVGGTITDVPIRKVPAAALQYLRGLREVKYRESLFELLSKQYEAARIDEARDASIIQVLDRAQPSEERFSPHRSALVLTATLLSFFVAIALAFVLEAWEHAKTEPRFAAELDLLSFYLRRRWFH